MNKSESLRHSFIIILFLSLSACSSIPIEQINDRIQAWKNTNIDQLIKYWGIPSKKQEINGIFYAEWLNKESDPNNTAITVGTGSYSRYRSIGLGLTLFDFGGTDDVCSRMVTYDDEGYVIDVSWKGTRDYCYKITPVQNKIIINKAIMKNNRISS